MISLIQYVAMFQKYHIFVDFWETFMNISWETTTDDRMPSQNHEKQPQKTMICSWNSYNNLQKMNSVYHYSQTGQQIVVWKFWLPCPFSSCLHKKKEKTVFLEFFNASLNFVLIKLNKTLETSIARVCNNHTKY